MSLFAFSEPANNAKNVYYDGQYIGFQDCEGNTGVYLQRCGNFRRENYIMSVTFGQCAWCGWNANFELKKEQEDGVERVS